MFTRGEFTVGNVTYGAILKNTRTETEAILITSGTIVSAYKSNTDGLFSYNNNRAKELVKLIENGIKGCTKKNCTPMPFVLGALMQHEFKKLKVEYIMQMFRGEVVGAYIQGSNGERVELEYTSNISLPNNIPYTKLTQTKKELEVAEDDLDTVLVRSVEEIAIEKEDITWLQKKKYYVVNDDNTAEELFTFLDNYDGPIAYDTETTGLKINCFGKIGSKYKEELEKYNKENPDDKIRADRLVGIIFCVENDVSYYFPCFNRKFKNLYQDKDSLVRINTINKIKSRYTVGDLRDEQTDIAKFIRSTPSDELEPDVILMERCRDILQKKHLVTHNGTFEWKVGYLYDIDTNISDDTMIMHQLMYKFRSTTSNSGEPSNLKYLAKRELGIEQWELSDFFPSWKADNKGTVRAKVGSKQNRSNIDFSYMDYNGARVYAPTDGDVTFQLFKMYKEDMINNHKDIEYIYQVELIVACAVAYMEFYGHKIDESKIIGARDITKANIAMIESEIRQTIGYANEKEIDAYNDLKILRTNIKNLEKINTDESNRQLKEAESKLPEYCDNLNKAINENTENVLNLSSPSQVCDLFYSKLKYPMEGDKPSVAKKQVKALLKEKNDDGTPKYPVVQMYSNYKNEETLLTKFFDNLPYFMYPGGFIFSSYGQIAAATGRMSCKHPNAQQYPKVITKIVKPRDGYVMMDADYSQIEYRVLTALAHNTYLADLFKNPDSDYHTLMASLMYDVPYASVTSSMRSAAKSFNFGIPYGMGFGSLAILLTGKNTVQTRDEAKEKYELYFKNQPMTRKFFDNVKEMAQINKFTKTLFNRYRYYSFKDKDGNVNNAKKAAALRQAGNAVIQGTAADIFKIGVARNFLYIRKNKLFGKLLIVNMVHDEQLIEVDAQSLNVQRVLSDIGKNMQFNIDGFPPLYIGAGLGEAWGYAKGKMAEIHPTLLEQLTKESINIPIFRESKTPVDTQQVLEYFNNRIYEFRRNKVAEYLKNPDNWHTDIHPAIGGLINLQFNYGRGESAKSYVGKDGETYNDQEFLELNIADFLKENNIQAEPSWFKANEVVLQQKEEDECDSEYSDEDDEDNEMTFDIAEGDNETAFSKIDESSELYGSSLQDLISIFGVCVIESKKICGLDMRNIYYKNKDELIDYIMNFICDEDSNKAMEIVWLIDGNILKHTGIYINNIKPIELESKYKAIMSSNNKNINSYKESEAEINYRAHA